MKAVYDAGNTDIARDGDPKNGFIFPSYVEDIMGPELFDYGYGPFRWVCLSGKHEDLVKTDQAAMACIDPNRRGQDRDNYNWIRDAEKNNLVVGTQARILYQDAEGRLRIALKFNEMVRRGEVGPIMLGRDHHDVSGTDSMLWDVMGGVARRSWARNPHAMETAEEFNRTHADQYSITMPYVADDALVSKLAGMGKQ